MVVQRVNNCGSNCPFESDIKEVKELCREFKKTQQDFKSDQREIRTALLGQMTGDQGGLIAKVHSMQADMERYRKWKIAVISLSLSGIVSLVVGLILTFAKGGA